MNKITSAIYFLFLSIIFFGCSSKQHNNLEQHVYESVFENLIDSTIIDYRKLVIPSPSDFENAENRENLSKRVIVNEKRDLRPLIVYIKDTIKGVIDIDHVHNKIKLDLSNKDYKYFINNSVSQRESSIIKFQNFIIDISKYELKHDSIKLEDKNSLRGIDKSRISATYHLSRIYFNKENTLGFFTLGLVYGRLNSVGVIVIVKKENNNWVIKKVINDWVS